MESDAARNAARRALDRPAALALGRALDWLRRAQQADGGFGGDDEVQSVVLTGLALLAFLGDGSTMRSGLHKDGIKRAVLRLRQRQAADGGFLDPGDPPAAGFVHAQAIATLAMIEAYRLSQYKILRKNCQTGLQRLRQFIHTDVGLRSDARARTSDPSLTVWALLVYTAAEEAGLAVADGWRDAVAAHLQTFEGRLTGGSVARGPFGAALDAAGRAAYARNASAVALCARTVAHRPDAAATRRAVATLERSAPSWTDDGSVDLFAWLCVSHALHELGGAPWDAWSKAVRETLIAAQHKGGDLAGSFDPVGVWGRSAGRVYATAMAARILVSQFRSARGGISRAPAAAAAPCLTVKVTSHERVVGWTVGPKRIGRSELLRREVRAIMEDPERRVAGVRGGQQRLPVDLRPGDGVCFGDVAATVEVLRAANVECALLSGRFPVMLDPSKAGDPATRTEVRVDGRGRVFLGEVQPAQAKLLEAFDQAVAAGGKAPSLRIVADGRVPWPDAQRVVDLGQRAGFTAVELRVAK